MSKLQNSKDRPIDSKLKTPLIGGYSDGDDSMMTFKVIVAAKYGISAKAFIVLDSQTLKDGGKTCRVSTHDDDRDEENYHARVAFCRAISSAVAALNILEQCTDKMSTKRRGLFEKRLPLQAVYGAKRPRRGSNSLREAHVSKQSSIPEVRNGIYRVNFTAEVSLP